MSTKQGKKKRNLTLNNTNSNARINLEDSVDYVIYGTEKDAIGHLSKFVTDHPKLSDKELHRLVSSYYYLNCQYKVFLDRKKDLLATFESLEKDSTFKLDNDSILLLKTELEEINSLISMFNYDKKLFDLRSTIINHNLRLVIKIANTYANKGLAVDDLIQEAVLGFCYALDRYDPSRHVKLGTYATWWIRQRITRSLSNKARLVRLPVHSTINITKILGAARKHKFKLKAKTNIKALSKATNIKEKNVAEAIENLYSFVPYNQKLNTTLNNDEDLLEKVLDNEIQLDYLGEVSDAWDQESFQASFVCMLQGLNYLEIEYLCLSFGLLGRHSLSPKETKQWLTDQGIANPVVYKKQLYYKLFMAMFNYKQKECRGNLG